MKVYALIPGVLVCALINAGCHHVGADTAYLPTVQMRTDPGTIESGATATIIAAVQEGMTNKPGMNLKLTATGNCGKLSVDHVTTGMGMSGPAGPGEASVTFTGNSPISTCSEWITATTDSNASAAALITVTPKKLLRVIPDSAVPPGETAPTVEIVPDVQMPVSQGFKATYTVTATGCNITRLRFVTTQKATFATNNKATPAPTMMNENNVQLIEPTGFNSEVVMLTSDSVKLGSLTLTITLSNPFGGKPFEITVLDPASGKTPLPGPG